MQVHQYRLVVPLGTSCSPVSSSRMTYRQMRSHSEVSFFLVCFNLFIYDACVFEAPDVIMQSSMVQYGLDAAPLQL